jgi:hypothetical protein
MGTHKNIDTNWIDNLTTKERIELVNSLQSALVTN